MSLRALMCCVLKAVCIAVSLLHCICTTTADALCRLRFDFVLCPSSLLIVLCATWIKVASVLISLAACSHIAHVTCEKHFGGAKG